MDDMVAWLRALIAADERRALEVGEQRRHWVFSDSGNVYVKDSNELVAVGPWDCNLGDDDGQHIAAFDPARVLNQCAALSDMLTELEQIHERSSDPDARNHASSAMGRMALIWITADELDAKWLAWKAAQVLLTAADPEPPVGAEVADYLGRPWSREPEGYWLRTDDLECDPESWTKVAGNYGPVRLTYSPAKETRDVDG